MRWFPQWYKRWPVLRLPRRAKDKSLKERQVDLEKALARFSREQAKANLLWEQTLQQRESTLNTLRVSLDENRAAMASLEQRAEERGRAQLAERLLPELLALLDDLQQAANAMEQQTAAQPGMGEWAAGLRQVHAHGEELLAFWGITPLLAVGQPFNPALHRPVEVVATGNVIAPTVLAEVQRGYLQGERLWRAAAVIVAKPFSGDEASNSPDLAKTAVGW